MDDKPRICESVRFWRLNAIAALEIMPRLETNPERFARDPDHLAMMEQNSLELARLRAREGAVRARAARIYRTKTP